MELDDLHDDEFLGFMTNLPAQMDLAADMRASMRSPSVSDDKETTLSSVDSDRNLKVNQAHVKKEDLGSGFAFDEGVAVAAYHSGEANPNKVKDVKSGGQHFNERQPRGNEIGTYRVNSHWRAALLYPDGSPTNLFGSTRVEEHNLLSLDGWLPHEAEFPKVPATRLSMDERNESSWCHASHLRKQKFDQTAQSKLGTQGGQFDSM